MGYVDVALDAALLEGHVVLCKGARLVSEDVLHLRVPHTQVNATFRQVTHLSPSLLQP